MSKNYKIIDTKTTKKISLETVAKALGAKEMSSDEKLDLLRKAHYNSMPMFEYSSEGSFKIVPKKEYLDNTVIKEVQLSKRKDWLKFEDKHINLAEPFPYKQLNELPNVLAEYSDNDLDKLVEVFPSIPKKELEYIRFLEQFLSKKGNYRPKPGEMNDVFRKSLGSDDYNLGH